jgi:hypothetical protein
VGLTLLRALGPLGCGWPRDRRRANNREYAAADAGSPGILGRVRRAVSHKSPNHCTFSIHRGQVIHELGRAREHVLIILR